MHGKLSDILRCSTFNYYLFFRFEEQNAFIAGGRSVFEKAIEFFGDEYINETLFIAFAKFEERQKEVLNYIQDNFIVY